MVYEQVKNKVIFDNTIYEKRCIHIVSISIFIMGVINIASAWLSLDYIRLNILKSFFEYQLIIGSRYLVIITGIISLIVAPTLYRQKRIAWYMAVILLAVSGFAHIIKNADIEEASICILLLGILLPLHKLCYVKSDPAKIQHGGWIFFASVLFVILYTFVGIHVFADKLGLNLTHIPDWKITINALMFDISALHAIGYRAKFFVDSLLAINSFAMLIGISFALSPVIARSLPEVNYDKFKKIADKKAVQPVQYFTLDKAYQHYHLKNETGESFISYKVSNRVALAIGNPCGDASIKELTRKWMNHVVEYDWIPAVYQAQGDFLDVLKELGFSAVPVGVEAVVNLKNFKLEGKAMQSLRTAKNKAEREGWIVREYQDSDWEQIKKLDAHWLNKHGDSENSFAMGTSNQKYLSETRTMLLLDKDNNLAAYLNNVELSGINGRSVDIMRRDPKSPNSAMEVLFLYELIAAKEENLEFYDLGFSPLAKIDQSLCDNKAVVKLFELLFKKQRRYYDFQGLYQFKSKFSPEWKPSYLVYPSQIDLPNVLLTLLNLNKGN